MKALARVKAPDQDRRKIHITKRLPVITFELLVYPRLVREVENSIIDILGSEDFERLFYMQSPNMIAEYLPRCRDCDFFPEICVPCPKCLLRYYVS